MVAYKLNIYILHESKMKKKKLLFEIFVILIGPVSAFLGFYPQINCHPNQMGFWIILALGIASGVVISKLVQRNRDNTTKETC